MCEHYELEKRREGRPEKLRNGCAISGETAERLSEEYGVSARTIQNDAEFAEAVDTRRDWLHPSQSLASHSPSTASIVSHGPPG
jgi:hypothetical protein